MAFSDSNTYGGHHDHLPQKFYILKQDHNYELSEAHTTIRGMALTYACAQPYHPGSDSHGQLFRPC